MMSLSLPGLLLLVVSLLLLWLWSRKNVQQRNNRIDEKDISNPYNEIEAWNHDWKTTEHVKIRPFKDKYHLTMGLQSCTINDLVLMDKTYKDRIDLRRQIIKKETKSVIGYNAVAKDAVLELYYWLFAIYLSGRFPSMFVIEHGRMLRNLVTDETVPLHLDEPEECLKIMGQHVDCEFAILLPVQDPDAKPFVALPTNDPKEVYHLHAFVLVFPSGFDTPKKLGLPLAAIHGPVPGYAQKLEKSMDRYFSNLPFGKVVQRANWSISKDGVLFKLNGMHLDIRPKGADDNENGGRSGGKYAMAPPTYDATEEDVKGWKEASKKIDPTKCALRMERQTLHRLEKTGALVFGFKTLLEPLSKLKEEGSGPSLAQALNSLRAGTVRAMDVYKDGVIWREPLIKYLNS